MITKCKECGHIVSDKAIVCPECGCPLNGQTHSDVYEPSNQPTSESANRQASESTKQQSYNTTNQQTKSEQEPYQYKYNYKPNTHKGCWGCFLAVLIVFLLLLVGVGAVVFGCVDYVMNYTTSSDLTTIIDEFSSDDETEAAYDYTDADEADEQAEMNDEETENTNESEETEPTATLHGYIGGTTYTITMNIFIDDEGNASGHYFYDSQGTSSAIQLLGNYQDPYLTIYESITGNSNQAPYFEGKYDGKTFAGSYTNSSGAEYAFMLKVEKEEAVDN